MTAAELARLIPHAREIKTGLYAGSCPAHGGKSRQSFRWQQASDRILAKCWAGCETADVIAAVGLKLSDLFDSPSTPPTPEQSRHRLALDGLEDFRQRELTNTAADIRYLQGQADNAAALLQSDIDDNLAGCCWDAMADAYHALTVLEDQHERLNSRDRADHVSVWRELQAVRNG